jgi:DNA-binding NtrC family response regulator
VALARRIYVETLTEKILTNQEQCMNGLKILVVDDDAVTRSLLTKRLTKESYDVETAEDGAKALDLIDQRSYDVILTDLMMPQVDGIGVLEAAKKISIKTEVILITAHASLANAIEAMKKGAADYLQKPINMDELILRLQKIRHTKTLIKNAADLREAMDVTEKNSAETIQRLELMVNELETRLNRIAHILKAHGLTADERIQKALAQ